MSDKDSKFNEKQTNYDADFYEMYLHLTSASIQQASDEVFMATAEELAEAYKPDDDSV